MASSRNLSCLVAAAVLSVSIGLPRAEALPTLDLTTLGSSGTVNGAYFEQVDASSTGTGTVNTFLRMGANGAVERGYNTDGTVEFDTKDDPHTHSLLLSSVPIVEKNGIFYREFLLDINESGGAKSTLSLDKIEIYLAAAGNLTGYSNWGTPIFDLDLGGDNWILLDAGLNTGSGSGDIFAYIPNTLFSGGTYVYLYSEFGESESSKYPNNGGFEEWAVQQIDSMTIVSVDLPPTAPAPAALLLALSGSSVVVSIHRRRKS